jgi:hypothetical protein
MALPQDISPLNSTIIDSLAKSSEMEWIPNADDPQRAAMKILWTGAETGTWAVLLSWKKGYSAPPHKHLSAAHTFVLSGKLQVRTGILEAGDYLYEANGMLHGATTALEDTEYLFICNGAVLFFNENGFTSYLSWEELRRIEAAHEQKKADRSAA